MDATSSSSRTNRLLLVLLLVIAAVFGTQALIQLGIHAPIRHGVEAAASVSSLFNSDGSCNRGPSIEMQSRFGTWLNLCFFDDGAAAWITTRKISDPAGREVTTIPREQMSKPIQYLRSVLIRDGYIRSAFVFHGEAPGWFTSLLDELVSQGLLLP